MTDDILGAREACPRQHREDCAEASSASPPDDKYFKNIDFQEFKRREVCFVDKMLKFMTAPDLRTAIRDTTSLFTELVEIETNYRKETELTYDYDEDLECVEVIKKHFKDLNIDVIRTTKTIVISKSLII